MKKGTLTEILFLKKIDKKSYKKTLILHLLELILLKKIMMQIMKLVECKHLLASIKIIN